MKIGSSYSFWSDVKRGVPQGSILGSLLFNVFINYLFMFIENCEICNFADDNTLYSGGMELSSILENLKQSTKILRWFRINSLKANPGEFQFMILLADTANSKDSKGREGTFFIPLYHFHPLTNIQTFTCNFAHEATITYF